MNIVCYRIGMEKQNAHVGFTLIELLLVVAIGSILAVVAIPAMKNITIRNRMVTEVNSLTTAMNLARSEAIKRNNMVVVCKSASPASCSPTGTTDCCTSSGDWTQGWLIFVDTNNDKKMIGDDNDEVLRIGDPLSGVTPLVGSGNAENWVSFNAYGVTLDNDSDVIKTCTSPISGVVFGRTFSVTGRISNDNNYTCP